MTDHDDAHLGDALDAGLRAAFGVETNELPASVLDLVESRTGSSARILIGDDPAAAPIIDASSAEARQRPRGRGQYQVMGEIARGGMGVILKGHDNDLGRDVAMKVLLAEHAGEPAVLQRFVEEAQIGGQLQHPGIVPVYELGMMADARPYFTMKLVKGRTLSALITDRAALADDRPRFLSIFEQVCQTVAYAHSRKVIHRDLKPANVMVGAFGEVQVVDWGLAKVIREGGISDEERSRQRSHDSVIETIRSGSNEPGSESLAGSVMGTPAYMSPEQARGEIDRLDERTDVFALGAVLCEILTGLPPYVGDGLIEQAGSARLDRARRDLAECGADSELVELALRCMAPARAARPRNAGFVVHEVQAYVASLELRAREAHAAAARASQERRARKLTVALAASILLATVLGGAGSRRGEAGREHARASHVAGSRAVLRDVRQSAPGRSAPTRPPV